MPIPSILIINASLHGDSGDSNTNLLLRRAQKELSKKGANTELIHPQLVDFKFVGTETAQNLYVLNTNDILQKLDAADGILIGTGTYWGQSSSILQRFLEEATPREGSEVWLGKPAGIIISEHSTGGQIVLSNAR